MSLSTTNTSLALRVWIIAVFGIVCLAALPDRAGAQPTPDEMESVAGRSFLLVFPDTSINEHDHEFVQHTRDDQFLICVYSAVANKIAIRGPGGYNKPDVDVTANQFLIIDLMKPEWRSAYPVSWEVGKIVNSTFRVDAQEPVVIYCMMFTEFGSEAWTPMPVEKWGTEYYAAARDGEVINDVSKGLDGYNKWAKPAGGEICMIAAYDGTQVSFSTSEQLHDNYPRSVTLNAGQTYTIQSYVNTNGSAYGDEQPDLGGTRIVGTKPIAVISGNPRAQVISEGEGLTMNPWKNMLIEWVPPVEQHGTEFIYMPTWDSRRPSGEFLQYKRQAEFVRLYATRPGNTEGYYTTGEIDSYNPIDPFPQTAVTEIRLATVPPRYFRTNQPAMAMMNSSAVVRFNEILPPKPPDDPDPKEPPPEPDTLITLSRDYEGWGAYMVEMVPREQWTSFAPYWSPTSPGEMEHFINVVTDTANRNLIMRENGTPFFFNRGEIPNTGLIWGSMSVEPATTHWLRATNGGRFYAVTYGLLRGLEQYVFIPGAPPKGGGPPEDKFEHREYMALSYGYPLSPKRNVLRTIDTLQVLPTMGCTDLSVQVNFTNRAPSGIRVIKLEPATNAQLKTITPASYIASPTATIVVEPIDKRVNASGTLVIVARSGQEFTVPFSYIAEAVTFDPPVMVDFGAQTFGVASTRDITITNRVAKTLDIRKIRMRFGNQDFRVVSTTPALPAQLATGASMTVTIEAKPMSLGRLFNDSLVVETACTTSLHPMRMETVQPFIQVGDLDFGPVPLNRYKDLPLAICNAGRGVVTFHDSLGNDVISWNDQHYIVSDVDKAKLRNMRLNPDQCDTIMVRFQADASTGQFRTTARLIANTRLNRDTSVWTAIVRIPGPQLDGVEWGPEWLTSGDPCSKNPLSAHDDSIVVFNTGSSDFTVRSLALSGPDAVAGFFVLDRTDPGATVDNGTVVAAITNGDTTFRFQKVLFKPTAERTDYSADVTMVVFNPVSGIENTVTATLRGIGIQSHVAISDYTFDTVQFAGAGSTMIPGQVSFEVRPTRATMITDVQVLPNNGEFVVTNLASLQRTWLPGETGTIQLEFRPQQPELRTARIVIIGDQSKCDDSEGALAGYTRRRPIDPPPPPTDTLGAAISDADFGALTGCKDTTGSVVVRNTGSVALTVTGIALVDGAPEFTLDALPSPVVIAAGATRAFAVSFAPSSNTSFTGHVRFDMTFAGSDSVISRVATLTGSGIDFAATASIATTFRAIAGARLDVPVMLTSSLNDAGVSDVTLTLRYQNGMMFADVDDPSHLVSGTLLNGWNAQVVSHAPNPADTKEMVLTVRASSPSGASVNGTGQLLTIPFRTLIGDTMRTALPFSITSASSPCVRFTTTQGAAALDSICGLSFRAIKATGVTYALEQNTPNPFNPTTTIEFAVGLDGQTAVVVYDALGRRVATLVDAYLKPGTYSVTWDASAFPSGLYYYRLTNGQWSRTNTMMLQK